MFFESYIWDTLFAEQKYIGKVFLVNIYKTYFNLSYKILSYSTYRSKSNEKTCALLVRYIDDRRAFGFSKCESKMKNKTFRSEEESLATDSIDR